MEVWKDVINYEGLYQISNLGRVKTNKTQLIKKNSIDKYGYYIIGLWIKGERKTFKVHRLVAQAFIPNPENKPTVNHKDGNKLNNNVENLEWATNQEQLIHSNRVLGKKGVISEKCREKQLEKQRRKIIRSDGKIYNSIEEAHKDIGVSYSNIWKCCKGKRQHAGGYSWEYV